MIKRLAFAILTLLVASTGAAAQDAVRVRVGEHPGFSRLVFDWPRLVDYRVEEGASARIVFAAPASFDAERLRKDPPQFVTAPATSGDAISATLAFTAAEGARFRHFRDGPRIVLDILAPANAAKAEEAKPVPAKEAPKAEAPKTEPAKAEPKAAEAKPVAPKPAPVAAMAPPAAPPMAAPAAKPIAAAKPAVAMTPQVRVGKDGTTIMFPWPEPVAAAAFRRAGMLWLAFDGVAEPDAKPFTVAGAPWGKPQVIAQGDGYLVGLTLPAELPVALEPLGANWAVTIGRVAGAPGALDARREVGPGGPRVVLPGVAAGKPIVFVDPEVGDRLSVLPLRARANVPEQRDFAEFALLPSIQGVVMEPRADGVVMRPLAEGGEGVEVAAAGGLMLSGARRNKPDVTAKPMIVRFDEWRRNGRDDYAGTKQALVRAVAEATPAGRNAARLNLARFHFAMGQSAEAIGILTRVAKDDPTVERGIEFRALRGAAYLRQANYPKAAADLNTPVLDADAEFALWRGELAAQQEDWKKAHDQFLAAGDAAYGYPPAERGRFRLNATRAHLKAGDMEAADAELRALNNDPLDARGEADLKLLRAELAAASGDGKAALAEFDRARGSADRRVRAIAELGAVNAGLADNSLKPADAIERLERARYAWRGDGVELGVLRKLGNLQLGAGDYRAGFATLKQAMTVFPKAAERPAIAHEMSEAFARLFLDPGAEKTPPLTALALHQEFKELTPVGPRGDEIIRRLADRLVAVDLLDRAAGLLDHQVNFRLQGEDKARVAARLAVIQLLDRKPAEALKALQASQQPNLPGPLAAERRLLEARAQADLNKYPEALAILAAETNADAETLRADIYWRAKDWPKAAASLDKLLGPRAADARPLTPAERRQVLQQALALSMAGDAARLAAMNATWAKRLEGSAEAEAFALAVSRTGADGEFRQLAGAIAKVGQLEAFMASYRDRLAKGGLSAIN